MAVRKNSIRNEDGQAIFEMVIFVPIFIFLFTVIYNVGSAINISINQQKAARRYFYYLAKGNSSLPLQFNLSIFREARSYRSIGMAFTGYRQRSSDGGNNGSPVATCMKFSSIFTGNSSEECEDPIDYDEDPVATSFIRIYSGYGVCGDTFFLEEQPNIQWVSGYASTGREPDPRSSLSGCIMAQ